MQIRKLDNDMLENGRRHGPNQTASENSELHRTKFAKSHTLRHFLKPQ